MDNNTIIGYNILAKRAIETESGVNIDEALKRITAYRVVRGEGADNHPASNVTVSTKILYFTKSGDEYTGWIWVEGEGWICTGSASADSWKAWSEQHGSSSATDDSVYVGPENTLGRSDTYVLGKNNSASNSSMSADKFAGTDIVMLGTNNSSEDGANVYQLGRDNRVVGNNLGNIASYPKQVAVNIGIDNQIRSAANNPDYGGEGINIGKSNTAEEFSIAIGQNNTATCASIVIGENLNLENGSNYARTAIGHAQKAYTVSALQYAPALNGYPIGKYELLDFRNFGRLVNYAWFDSNGKPIELKRYYAVVNTNTGEVKFEEADSGYSVYTRSARYGYIDDNGLLISTDGDAPSGKVKATYTPYYRSRNSSSYFWGTTSYTRYVKITQFTPVIWQTYKLSEVEQYFASNNLGNVYISANEAYANTSNNDFILYKVRVTGKEENGSFIPWFNNNFDLSECITRDFYPSALSYSSDIRLEPAITLSKETCGKTLEDLNSGSTLFGALAKVEFGALGVTATHPDTLSLNYTALPGYKTVSSTRYYLNGSSSSSEEHYTFCSVDNPEVLTPTGILGIIMPIVHNGGVGIAAMTSNSTHSFSSYSNFSTSLEVSYGALGIGDRMYVDSGAIGIGRNQSGIGSGTIAIGEDNIWGIGKWNNSYGATLIGTYNTATYSSGLLHGATVVGNHNYLDNYAHGTVMLGNYNRFDSYSSAYGSVVVGVNSSIKGAGSIAIGTGYSGGGGAHARYAAIAISYKGAIASDNGVALGGNGCAAFSGATSIGWCGCMSYSGGISLGWNGVTAQYGSISIGHDGITTLRGGVSIGWNGVCSQYGSIAIGYYGAFSTSGSLAIGYSGVNSLSGAIAIGYYNSYADNGGMAFGNHTVKGKSGSIAIGICGTYAHSGSIAIGHKALAMYGGLSVINNTTTGPDYTFEENPNLQFVEYRDADGSYCYPEFRVLKGIATRVDYIYGVDGEVVDTIENPTSGRYSVYKTATGKYYSALRDIPYYEWSKVWIRATRDENDNIKPFYGMKVGILDAQERVDNWIEVPINRSGSLQIGECRVTGHPSLSSLEMDCAIYGGSTFGGKAFAKNGAVAIGTDYSSGKFDCSDKAVTIDGNECREYTRYAGRMDGTKFYPWNVYQAYANENSVAIGSSVIATNASIAMGIAPVKATDGSMALGYGASVDYQDLIYGTAESNSLLICGIDNTDNVVKRGKAKWKSIGIGTGVVASSDSIAIGDRTEADEISSAIGFCSTAANESIAYGDSNHSSLNAIAIGSRNISSGWSIALGVNNTSYDGPGGHATMIGQFNTSTSNQEVIHKEFQIYVDGKEPTQEQIDELTGLESAYRSLLDPYLDSEKKADLDETDAGNNEYYLGHADEMAWEYSSYYMWLQTLGNQPPFIFSSSDRAALEAIMRQSPQTLEENKTLMLQICDILQNYANVDMLRSYINAATTMDDINAIWSTQLLQAFSYSLQWTGESIPGVVSDYDTMQQILTAYFRWNEYGLSIRSSLAPHYETIDEDVVCNSFLAGNNNKSNHYNSILIGSLNESQAPLVQPDQETHETDDDGFMLAVGYRNVVGRNYDMAFGYLSKAIGGENVALQHSEAKGYRNFAAFDSKVRGTANVLLGESTLIIPWSGGSSGNIDKLNAATHNLMFNSLSEHTTQPINGYMQNVLLDVDLVTDTQSVTENFIYGGAGHANGTKVELTADYAVTGNVILGSQHGSNQLKITCTNAIIDNIISHPSAIIANALYAFHRNILIGQKYDVKNPTVPAPIMNITNAGTIIKNIVIHGSIIGQATAFTNNIVLNDSQIESTYDLGDGGCVINNILLNTAKLTNTDTTAWWTNWLQPSTENVIIGANVSDSINSVIISDSGDCAEIHNALRIFNFGDNRASEVAEGRVFGGENLIQRAKKFFISGDYNTVNGSAESMLTENGANSFTTIFGSDNSVASISDEVCKDGNSRNTIFGCKNAIYGSLVSDNTILGSQNQITGYNITECFVSGSDNLISSRVNAFTILGKSNSVYCNGGPSDNKLWAIGNGFVQGNNNRVEFGSNTIAMGNGNNVEGHNSVAIGCQLKSNQWQTVIGKYNQPVDGPDRLIPSDDPSQSNKALFIIGNGYSAKDYGSWQDEQFITRSNAMEVYADGRLKVTGDIEAANIPAAPVDDGTYALGCDVVNGVATYRWVPVGLV